MKISFKACSLWFSLAITLRICYSCRQCCGQFCRVLDVPIATAILYWGMLLLSSGLPALLLRRQAILLYPPNRQKLQNRLLMREPCRSNCFSPFFIPIFLRTVQGPTTNQASHKNRTCSCQLQLFHFSLGLSACGLALFSLGLTSVSSAGPEPCLCHWQPMQALCRADRQWY